jgi:uroporphyrin-III C-methyltransferase/precorrin-2 dehydrogenase/sirohydrochlorin ferrochelatase
MKPQSRLPQQSSSARIEPLAVLPVFLDLHGKSALVVGTSEGALWKAELLLQAGANVTIVCEIPTSSALQWAENAEPGRVAIEVTPWREISFSGTSLVVADVDKSQAADLAAKARAAGSLVNIVDQPVHCQFQFGSIVNKSPLVIGISTGGAAPVLAQLVRSLIETALPDRLQTLARKAQALRKRVNERLHGAGLRRSYWNAYFGRAFGKISTTQGLARQTYGIGVSDVADLTLRDLEMLRRADRVICLPDSNPAIAALARREAARQTLQSEAVGSRTGAFVVTIGAASCKHKQEEGAR